MQGRKLLLADDSITIQKVVDLTFTDEGVHVITASDGEQAIAKIEEDIPDIVLADVFMPHRSGYKVCEYIKESEHLRHIPVMLLVGTFEPFDEAEARRVKADDVLTKPFRSIRELVSKVSTLLGEAYGAAAAAAVPEAAVEVAVAAAATTTSAPTASQHEPASQDEPFSQQGLISQPVADAAEPGGTPQLNFTAATPPPNSHTEDAFADFAMDDQTITVQPVGQAGAVEGAVEGSAKRSMTQAGEPLDFLQPFDVHENASAIHEAVLTTTTTTTTTHHRGTEPQANGDALLDLGDTNPPPAEFAVDDCILDLPVEGAPQAQDVLPLAQQTESAQDSSEQVAPVAAIEFKETPPNNDASTLQFANQLINLEQVSPEVIEAIARQAVVHISEKIVRQIAWEVVPQLAELLIKQRLEQEALLRSQANS